MRIAPAPAGLVGQLVELGSDRALWQPDTGRHLRITADTPLADPPPALARRLAELGFTGAPSVRIPARSRWALAVPGALWHARPLARGPGGFPFAELPMDAEARAVWLACDGKRDVAGVAAHTGLGEARVRDVLRPWMDVRVQAVQLRARPVRADEPALAHLLAPRRPAHRREAHHYADGSTDLDRYHAEEITDGARHFDDRETTFAHCFAQPHDALGGRAYGQALADSLRARGWPVSGVVLEIGPGTGELCAAFSRATAPDRYLRLDLSPELLATQAARCEGSESLRGSATAIPLPDDSVDLALSNEMIADLRAAPTPEGFALAPEPGQALYNTGAFAMVAELARVLRPGGAAFVSEFGDPAELPEETTHLDHPEVSIHFGQLAAVAGTHGLEAELLPLAELLAVDRTAEWLSRPSWEALRARAHARHTHLPARAWSRDSLPLDEPVDGLWWVPVTEPGAGPVLDRLWALLLRKPA